MKSIKISLLSIALVSMGLSACASGTPQSSSQSSAQSYASAASAAKSTTQSSQAQSSVTLAQLQRMAQSGDADAQYTLGYRYYYGIGVKQNTETSLSWMTQAASQGQKQALQALKLVKQSSAVQNETQKKHRFSARYLKSNRSQSAVQQASYNKSASNPTATTIPGFTLQLMGTHDKQSLIDFIMTNNLQDKATYYRRSYDGQDWYVLVSGRYASQQEALNAIDQLPETLKSMNPWVKPLGLVKQEMQS